MGWWLQLRGQRPATSRPIRARGSHLSVSLLLFFPPFSSSLGQLNRNDDVREGWWCLILWLEI